MGFLSSMNLFSKKTVEPQENKQVSEEDVMLQLHTGEISLKDVPDQTKAICLKLL